MVRKIVLAGVLAGLGATAVPATARPTPRVCRDWEDVFCYSWRHEMFCQIYVREFCINLPPIEELINKG